jgi:hypothetical protein
VARRKKLMIIGLVAVVILVGSIAGLALAQTGTPSPAQPQTLWSRVATILGIDQQKLEDAVTQAQRDMKDESVDAYLKNLVDQGKITQQQADQYKSWWQARPQTALPGPLGGPGLRGFRGGMRGGRGFGWGAPPPAPPATPKASGT